MGQQIELPLMIQAKIIVEQGTQQEPGQIWERLTRAQKQAVMQQMQGACRTLTSRQKPKRAVDDDNG